MRLILQHFVKRGTWNVTSGTLSRVWAKSGKPLRVQAPEAVAEALAALLEQRATTLLVNSRGQPWKEDGSGGASSG